MKNQGSEPTLESARTLYPDNPKRRGYFNQGALAIDSGEASLLRGYVNLGEKPLAQPPFRNYGAPC